MTDLPDEEMIEALVQQMERGEFRQAAENWADDIRWGGYQHWKRGQAEKEGLSLEMKKHALEKKLEVLSKLYYDMHTTHVRVSDLLNKN